MRAVWKSEIQPGVDDTYKSRHLGVSVVTFWNQIFPLNHKLPTTLQRYTDLRRVPEAYNECKVIQSSGLLYHKKLLAGTQHRRHPLPALTHAVSLSPRHLQHQSLGASHSSVKLEVVGGSDGERHGLLTWAPLLPDWSWKALMNSIFYHYHTLNGFLGWFGRSGELERGQTQVTLPGNGHKRV